MSTTTDDKVETGLPVEQGNAVEKSEQENVQVEENEKPKINIKNWLNLLAYIVNIVFTFGVGTNGWFSGTTNGELSLKYQVCSSDECDHYEITVFSRALLSHTHDCHCRHCSHHHPLITLTTIYYRRLSLQSRMPFVFGF